ncbi:hypothetical protein DITRI_Ditri10aG0082800 [Diplodiscus trichospermus]
MGVARMADEGTKLKREDQNLSKDDSQFSKWKVLIGPNDWEDYSLGKEGVARYRAENLPGSSSSGLYELAIYCTASSSGDNPRKLDPDKLLVVYLGQADNVRTRLQQYGRTGAHLGRSCYGEKGCGCFEDIFSRGYTIVYRWAPMENKADTQRTEAQLLCTYDYAWNKGSNGARRHDDIIEKLDKFASNRTTLAIFSRKHLPFLQKQVGIKIKANKLLSQNNEFSRYADGESYNFLSQVFKFSRSQPRLVLDHFGFNKIVHGAKIPSISLVPSLAGDNPEIEQCSPICGVAMDDGSLCRQPVSGKKRCDLHKGRRIHSFNSEKIRYQAVPYVNFDSYGNEASGFDKKSCETSLPRKVETGIAPKRLSERCNHICGVELGDGYLCTKQPVTGRVRCEDHKGMRVTSLLPGSDAFDKDSKFSSHIWNYGSSSSSTSICGATTCNGSFCQRTVMGNGSCWQHLNSGTTSSSYSSSERYLNYGGSGSSICGAPTHNGSFCQRTVEGNGRCWQHLNSGTTSSSSARCLNYGGSGSSICGAPTHDSSFCQRTVKGNGRCWQHLNSGTTSSSSARYLNYGGSGSSICGAPTRNGSFCQRTVKGNGRCWQH